MGRISNILAIVIVTLVVKENLVEGAAPAFAATTGTASVAEDAATDTQITITATPVLSNTPTSVEIVSTTPAGAQSLFSVALNGAATGIVFKTAGALDRETTASYTVNIRASNADGSTSGNDLVVTVTVTDVNDNAPVFNPQRICAEMVADTAAGTVVTTLTATDADAGANVLAANPYTMTATKFEVAAGTGVITVKTGNTLAANYEETMTLKAVDGGSTVMTGSATIMVCVKDGCCTISGAGIAQGALAVIVLGLLSLFM